MRIDSDDMATGVPLIIIRDFLRGKTLTSWTIGHLANELKIQRVCAGKVLQWLISRGHVVQDKKQRAIERRYSAGENWERVHFYIVTEKGAALAIARASKPLLRSTAQARLNKLIERARQANRDERYLYRVAKIAVFGSFLDESKERINDVDVAVFYTPKETDKERFAELSLRKGSECRTRTFLDALCYPLREVEMFLKSRSTALSVHNWQEQAGVLRKTAHRVVFQEGEQPKYPNEQAVSQVATQEIARRPKGCPF
jgi:hypothetical protein